MAAAMATEMATDAMDAIKQMKNKFMKIVKPRVHGGARPVRVNLPLDLGGGFTMLMCFMEGGQSVSGFIRALISMLQNTNAILLQAREFGLTPHREAEPNEAPEETEERLGPPVFLKPDSLLADAFGDQEELSLDLRRLKPLRKPANGAEAGAGAEAAESASAAADAASSSSSSSSSSSAPRPFRVPVLPTPPAQTVFHYSCLAKLRRLKPPADPPAEVIVVSTLAVPCCLPYHLARSLPTQLQTAALTSSLTARQASSSARDASAAGGPTNVAAAASTAAAAAASSAAATAAAAAAAAATDSTTRRERRELLKRAKQLDEYAAHIYDLLLARGVGEDPHLKLQMAAQLMAASKAKGGDRIGTSTGGGNDMWGGWENEKPKNADADMLEVPLLFVRTEPMPKDTPKKFDVTNDCLVITNFRCVQISRGAIVEELSLGPDSGHILKLPKDTDDGTPGRCPVNILVKNAVILEKIERDELAASGGWVGSSSAAAEETKEDGQLNGAGGVGDDDDGSSFTSHRRSKSSSASLAALHAAASRTVSFWVPNPDIAGFIEEYLMYFQEKVSLESSLGLIEQARLDRIEAFKVERCLRGWTLLLKSLVGPIIFGPLRQPVYENSIKQVLAKVQQMDLKQVKITSLKLLEFHIPDLDAEEALGPDGDQIPSLRLANYTLHPDNEYVFDIFWSAPSFYIKVEISGKKIVSFKLVLEMRGVEVRGSLRLRSSPYEPEKSAVSFVSVPHLSFGVGSHVIVGSIKLPFQRAIEKIIYTQIQAAIEAGLKENVVGDKWQSIYYEKSGLGLLLDRWWAMSAYPFKYDGTDDEDMMSLALVVTSQAESGLSDTLTQMRNNRDKMQAYLGIGHAAAEEPATKHTTAPAATHAAAAASSDPAPSSKSARSSKSSSRSHGGSDVEEDDAPLPPSRGRRAQAIADDDENGPGRATPPRKQPAAAATAAAATTTTNSRQQKMARRQEVEEEDEGEY